MVHPKHKQLSPLGQANKHSACDKDGDVHEVRKWVEGGDLSVYHHPLLHLPSSPTLLCLLGFLAVKDLTCVLQWHCLLPMCLVPTCSESALDLSCLTQHSRANPDQEQRACRGPCLEQPPAPLSETWVIPVQMLVSLVTCGLYVSSDFQHCSPRAGLLHSPVCWDGKHWQSSRTRKDFLAILSTTIMIFRSRWTLICT